MANAGDKKASIKQSILTEPLTDPSQPCRLLQLPLKLRERIWEEAAFESDEIQLNRHSVCQRTPEWPGVSVQVFSEAFPIWLRTNKFTYEICEPDDIAGLRVIERLFGAFIDTAQMSVRVAVKPGFVVTGEILISWIRQVHSGGFNFKPTMESSQEIDIIYLTSMLEQALLSRATSWEDFYKVCEVSHRGFGLITGKIFGNESS